MKANRRKLGMAVAVSAIVTLGLVSAASGHGRGGHGQAGHGEMLKRADLNADGTTTVDEAKAAIAQHTASIDADKNGQITLEELQAFRAQQRQARQAARFATLDADKNGSVSSAEFSAAQEARIQRLDRNHDGVLDEQDRPQRGFHEPR